VAQGLSADDDAHVEVAGVDLRPRDERQRPPVRRRSPRLRRRVSGRFGRELRERERDACRGHHRDGEQQDDGDGCVAASHAVGGPVLRQELSRRSWSEVDVSAEKWRRSSGYGAGVAVTFTSSVTLSSNAVTAYSPAGLSVHSSPSAPVGPTSLSANVTVSVDGRARRVLNPDLERTARVRLRDEHRGVVRRCGRLDLRWELGEGLPLALDDEYPLGRRVAEDDETAVGVVDARFEGVPRTLSSTTGRRRCSRSTGRGP